jgi:peroxiredoxin
MGTNPPVCDFGWLAVDAELPGVDGKRHRLLEAVGPGGLVIAFICNHCPYVRAVIARIVRDAADLAEHGVGFAAVSSNDAGAYPDDSFDNMARFAATHRFGFAYLYDEDQSVARAYGAACTPDFFGFNARRELQYRGRLDASRRDAGPSDLRRDLYEAMLEVARTGQGPRDQVASIGCSIKWKNAA